MVRVKNQGSLRPLVFFVPLPFFDPQGNNKLIALTSQFIKFLLLLYS